MSQVFSSQEDFLPFGRAKLLTAVDTVVSVVLWSFFTHHAAVKARVSSSALSSKSNIEGHRRCEGSKTAVQGEVKVRRKDGNQTKSADTTKHI